MKTKTENMMFVMIDIQEKLLHLIAENQEVIKNANILNKASEIFGIPLLVTEQYKKGLGETVSEIKIGKDAIYAEKTSFSIFDEKISELLKKSGKKVLVMYGIEAHICVLQSVLDALAEDYEVYLVTDAVSSRKLYNKEAALDRMLDYGAELVTTEMLLFEILGDSSHPSFREISKLIK
ncbi:MAG: hydrolase [Candidatus Cloacimonadota bacterium]|nr:MAG: hydrolase [Candidatus Cloacimonadota bacterium]